MQTPSQTWAKQDLGPHTVTGHEGRIGPNSIPASPARSTYSTPRLPTQSALLHQTGNFPKEKSAHIRVTDSNSSCVLPFDLISSPKNTHQIQRREFSHQVDAAHNVAPQNLPPQMTLPKPSDNKPQLNRSENETGSSVVNSLPSSSHHSPSSSSGESWHTGDISTAYDNETFDYIYVAGEIIPSPDAGKYYQIVQRLGRGTFAQVVKCVERQETHSGYTERKVALKIIKNKPAYYTQGVLEVWLLHQIKTCLDPSNRHLVRLEDFFVYRNHLCIVFELLNKNLYDILKCRRFKGLPISIVCDLTRQMLESLCLLQQAGVIHCDMKPENVVTMDSDSCSALKAAQARNTSEGSVSYTKMISPTSEAHGGNNGRADTGMTMTIEILEQVEECVTRPAVKVIDFGSARCQGQVAFSYIQSRFYRAPEVLMGLPYNDALDVWSLGCIAAELYTGLPIFPGSSEFDQMKRITDIMGFPPEWMIRKGKHGNFFFRMSETKPLPSSHPLSVHMRVKCQHPANPESTSESVGIDIGQGPTSIKPSDKLSCVASKDDAASVSSAGSSNSFLLAGWEESYESCGSEPSSFRGTASPGPQFQKGESAPNGGLCGPTVKHVPLPCMISFKTPEEYQHMSRKNPGPPSKRILSMSTLDDLETMFPEPSGLTADQLRSEKKMRKLFVDFLKCLLVLDPNERWSAPHLLQHPFITSGTPSPCTQEEETPSDCPVDPNPSMSVDADLGHGGIQSFGPSDCLSHVLGDSLYIDTTASLSAQQRKTQAQVLGTGIVHTLIPRRCVSTPPVLERRVLECGDVPRVSRSCTPKHQESKKSRVLHSFPSPSTDSTNTSRASIGFNSFLLSDDWRPVRNPPDPVSVQMGAPVTVPTQNYIALLPTQQMVPTDHILMQSFPPYPPQTAQTSHSHYEINPYGESGFLSISSLNPAHPSPLGFASPPHLTGYPQPTWTAPQPHPAATLLKSLPLLPTPYQHSHSQVQPGSQQLNHFGSVEGNSVLKTTQQFHPQQPRQEMGQATNTNAKPQASQAQGRPNHRRRGRGRDMSNCVLFPINGNGSPTTEKQGAQSESGAPPHRHPSTNIMGGSQQGGGTSPLGSRALPAHFALPPAELQLPPMPAGGGSQTAPPSPPDSSPLLIPQLGCGSPMMNPYLMRSPFLGHMDVGVGGYDLPPVSSPLDRPQAPDFNPQGFQLNFIKSLNMEGCEENRAVVQPLVFWGPSGGDGRSPVIFPRTHPCVQQRHHCVCAVPLDSSQSTEHSSMNHVWIGNNNQSSSPVSQPSVPGIHPNSAIQQAATSPSFMSLGSASIVPSPILLSPLVEPTRLLSHHSPAHVSSHSNHRTEVASLNPPGHVTGSKDRLRYGAPSPKTVLYKGIERVDWALPPEVMRVKLPEGTENVSRRPHIPHLGLLKNLGVDRVLEMPSYNSYLGR
eukprot:GHVN01020530.1.p1 GENE.GHVN01020530.1~~GHVN01020530.1.p1  ORF type:complete len:1425 (+),score=149.67 GHVN01020530.1:221-4495(+)